MLRMLDFILIDLTKTVCDIIVLSMCYKMYMIVIYLVGDERFHVCVG